MTHIIRGCKESELVPKECTSGSSSLVHYKDCTESCITPGCNSELDGVAHKFVESSITRGVNECNTCKYVQGDDGSVTGNKYCLDQPNKIKGVKKECPLYAQGRVTDRVSDSSTVSTFNLGRESIQELD